MEMWKEAMRNVLRGSLFVLDRNDPEGMLTRRFRFARHQLPQELPSHYLQHVLILSTRRTTNRGFR